ncbi:peptidylprolyl isomerase [Polaribacter sp.]|nr:peptidylprolyl isomerase [Polaribacter sp.]
MQQRTTILKHIKITLSIVLCFAFGFTVQAQKTKIDGVSVVIGKNIVLDSDIEKFKFEIEQKSEGRIEISDCEMLEELMQQKLLAHHAIIDSVIVTDAQVESNVERNIAYFKQQTNGNIQKIVDLYGFNDLEDLKKEMMKVEMENLLIQYEREKIDGGVDVTPEEVRLFYTGLKKEGNLPEFPAEIKLAQLVINIEPSEREKEKTIEKLKEIKTQIEDGSSFRLKAIINSDDPGVTQNGGVYTVTKDAGLVKEFKETAFSLALGQISEPFETQYGYHIMQLNEVKGNTRIVSHILLEPEIPESKKLEAKEKVTDIIEQIKSGKITFTEAVKKYSTEKVTKNSGGILLNPQTNEPSFDLTRMEPGLYARVSDLKEGEMTEAYFDRNLQDNTSMYKFILVTERKDTHTADLVNDYEKVQKLALQKKKEETVEKWVKNKIGDTYVKLAEDSQKCTFKRNWKKTR